MTMTMKMKIIVGWRVSGLDKQGLGVDIFLPSPLPMRRRARLPNRNMYNLTSELTKKFGKTA
jgi:hypothetical protein